MSRTTLAGLLLIEAFEGLRTKAYRCPAGVWTIGVGHTSDAGGTFTLKSGAKASKVCSGQELTESEARNLFAVDIDKFEDQVERLIWRAKSEPKSHEFDALVSLAFNIGVGAFQKSTVLRKFLAGDKAGAADAFLAWNKATVGGKKVVVKGLVRRREAERWFFLGDREIAEKIAGTSFGGMPRAVVEPIIRETMPNSATGNTAIVTGGAGALTLFEGVKQVVATGQEVKQTADSAGELLFGIGASWFAVVGAVVLIGAGIIWWRRWRRSQDDEVIEADPGIDVPDMVAA